MKIKNVRAKHGRYYLLTSSEERSASTGRYKRQWLALTRVADGEAALHAKLAELLGADAQAGGNFCALLETFQAEHLAQLSQSAREEYRRNYAVIGKAFAEFDVDQVTTPDVRKFLFDNFAEAHTARRAYKARLSTFFRWCIFNGHATINPASFWLKQPPKRAPRVDAAVFHRLRDALPAIGQVFIDLLYLTQQRPTEIRRLRWSQVSGGLIKFRPTKTERSSGVNVSVPITPELAAVLERAKQLGKIKPIARGDAFVLQSRGGGRFSVTGLHSMWRRACIAIDLHGVTTRDVRPFALTEAERQGYRIEDLRKAAAHTTIGTTEGYLAQYRDVESSIRLALPEKPRGVK